MRSRLLPLALCAACGGGSSTDAGPGDLDAALIDARLFDAPPPADAVEPTCTPAAGTNLALQPVASGLSSPVLITAPPGDARLFILEQPGVIRIVKDGVLLDDPFLDIRGPVRSTGDEEGLLGLAFHPDYASNGRFFVYYTADDPDGDNLIAEYHVSADPDVADTTEERLLISPHPNHANHNGGNLVFGPDGYLYAGLGDGGGTGDPDAHGQDTTVILGKLLRIDVDSGTTYDIPPSNPFADSAGSERKEIWAYGLRNPWRWSFDRSTGDLYIGDVGQDDREEVDVQPAASAGGENYGWSIVEGTCCYPWNTASCDTSCDMTGMTPPVATYDHGGSRCAIVGGFVYRGTCLPDVQGWYFYGDNCSAQVWRIIWPGNTTPVELSADLASTSTLGGGLTSFGQDATGELYVADRDGEIFRIVSGN
ncbi:MAG TPA: PQQ-dependent sugar dehydrogenase [Kofleriaceae bacterium]|jgi:glucose/arabinose dehydrogenase|nr:PQQ-dependent sugar dehydrogenase [Kofleriaceae bacterium]